jgi:hypothetical protein
MYLKYTFIQLLFTMPIRYIICNDANQKPFCYLNNYSSQLNKFSFDNLNKHFTIGEGHKVFGCTVTISIDYRLSVVRLYYTTTTVNNDDDRKLLMKNKILIKVRELI